jgi:hypothetical protein
MPQIRSIRLFTRQDFLDESLRQHAVKFSQGTVSRRLQWLQYSRLEGNKFTGIIMKRHAETADAINGNLSTFVETYGTTYLDGSNSGHTVITVTPGIRATIASHHVFMAGVDFPLTDPNPFERIFRFTYIYCF